MSLLGKIIAAVRGSPSIAPVPADWDKPFDTLQRKWREVPVTRRGRFQTGEMNKMSNADLLRTWEEARRDITTGSQWEHRGWYHELYADAMRGKRIVDVGSGFGVDSITFAQHGASVTFLDLAESNLGLLRRLCGIMGLKDVDFVLLKSLDDIDRLPTELDVIMAMGSLHHAPQSVIRPEVAKLRQHLKIGGRWLQLAYPKTRWEREGRLSFDRWGVSTDGEDTPWGEWYDIDKLLELHRPAQFEVVLWREFHNSDFIWFDLVMRSR